MLLLPRLLWARLSQLRGERAVDASLACRPKSGARGMWWHKVPSSRGSAVPRAPAAPRPRLGTVTSGHQPLHSPIFSQHFFSRSMAHAHSFCSGGVAGGRVCVAQRWRRARRRGASVTAQAEPVPPSLRVHLVVVGLGQARLHHARRPVARVGRHAQDGHRRRRRRRQRRRQWRQQRRGGSQPRQTPWSGGAGWGSRRLARL